MSEKHTALRGDSTDLERYYSLVALYSPESHPELFPTEQSRLAYWINGYNAAVLKTVLHYYPISSVSDVKAPFLLFFMPENSGFFYSPTRSRPSTCPPCSRGTRAIS